MLRKLQFPIISILALIGLSDALYLTIKHLNGESLKCTITTGCDEVLSSSYAAIGPVPLSVLGLLAYFLVFCLAILATFNYKGVIAPLKGLSIAMFLFTIWLLYVQAFVLGHFCQYCLVSAVTVSSIFAIIAVALIGDIFTRRKIGEGPAPKN